MRRAICILSVSVLGCGVSLPDEYLVEDLRILEVRMEPPEIPVFIDAPLTGEPEELLASEINLEPVRMTALVAHPDLDADFDYQWIRCKDEPDEPGMPTTGFNRVPCEGAAREELANGQAVSISPISIALNDLADSGGDITNAVTSLASDPRDLFAGLYAHFNLQATVVSGSIEVDTTVLEANKRLVIFDPAIVAFVIRQARDLDPSNIPMIQGVDLPSLCTGVNEQALAQITDFLEERDRNRAPTFVSTTWSFSARGLSENPDTDTSTQSYRPGDPPIEITSADGLIFSAVALSNDAETYRVLDDRCDLIELDETLAWSWFTNAGELSQTLTTVDDDPRDDSRDDITVYRPPDIDDLDMDETPVRIWSVLRDGRGGSDSMFIDVVVTR